MSVASSSQPGEKCQKASTLRRQLSDHGSDVSASTSETETLIEASNHNKPPLLDFIGSTCMGASFRFTSYFPFPCAVMDINDDSDDFVMDRLSRESAMTVMYAKKNESDVSHVPTVLSLVELDSSSTSDGEQSKFTEENDENAIGSTLLEQSNAKNLSVPLAIDEDENDDSGIVNLREPTPSPDPVAINEGDNSDLANFQKRKPSMAPLSVINEDDDSSIVSLDEHMPYLVSLAIDENDDSDIVDLQEPKPSLEASDVSVSSVETLPVRPSTTIPPQKRKNKFGRKLFERKKKASMFDRGTR
mmetsp:Transcript_16627/g.34955  ORF Transcript_16627/g.34955 Transcript_16627/m.34955 type:complete len:302 (+) Transcript_16627:268-1173(+)